MARPSAWNAWDMQARPIPLFLSAVLVACLAALPAATPAARAEPLPDAERLLALFDAIVFGTEDPQTPAPERLGKWTGPIRLKLIGDGSIAYREAVEGYAAELSAITGIAVSSVPRTASDQNMVVRFTASHNMLNAGLKFEPDRALLSRVVERAAGTCYFLTYDWDDASIIYAAVVVNNDLPPERIGRCVLKELLRVLGLRNGAAGPSPSIFEDGDGPVALSPLDEALLRILYDPRLDVGLPREKALARARVVISELAP